MEPNKKPKVNDTKCQCMAAELIKLHYYDQAIANAKDDQEAVREEMENERILQIGRDATQEEIRTQLLVRIAHGWENEGVMRSELNQVTTEWQASMAVVGRLQRRVNNLVELDDRKERKLVVADHNLLQCESALRTLNQERSQQQETILGLKDRFVMMRAERDKLKRERSEWMTEREALTMHYEQVIKELNDEIASTQDTQ